MERHLPGPCFHGVHWKLIVILAWVLRVFLCCPILQFFLKICVLSAYQKMCLYVYVDILCLLTTAVAIGSHVWVFVTCSILLSLLKRPPPSCTPASKGRRVRNPCTVCPHPPPPCLLPPLPVVAEHAGVPMVCPALPPHAVCRCCRLSVFSFLPLSFLFLALAVKL